ncbi:MAG: Cys-Xaa-Xaa-Xaa repeat radical SAM target protein [Bacteroidales bacterium]|nr:Cys-Xaa-Xaa-Xaa repeat radical SAM target protein [Candidatus Sodaliphilus limicaballi]
MDKKMNNEELQSRREFFKKAAKATLPMIAAVALASAPAIVNAAETAPMGCSSDSCSYSCSSSCHKSCLTGCQGSCKTTCTGGCRGGYTNLK